MIWQKRTEDLHLRVSEEEMRRLREKAKQEGKKSVSQLVRDHALGTEPTANK